MTSGSERRQRTRQVLLRLTEEEHADLIAKAERAGMSFNAYLRHQALGAKGPRAKRRPRVDTVLLLDALGQVGRIGSNINQLAHAANAGGWPSAAAMEPAAQDVAAMRAAIRQALGKDG